jgi:hypothetical protein
MRDKSNNCLKNHAAAVAALIINHSILLQNQAFMMVVRQVDAAFFVWKIAEVPAAQGFLVMVKNQSCDFNGLGGY